MLCLLTNLSRPARLSALLSLVVGILALTPAPNNEAPRTIRNTSFGRGELLRYKVHYGIINAAEGEIETSGELHRINDRPCYRVSVMGRTTGSFDFFLRIRDTWRSYIHPRYRRIEVSKKRDRGL
jgi:Protein of unknown function (DUF3108)